VLTRIRYLGLAFLEVRRPAATPATAGP
jgi:hypothetical protein